jgi:lysozyme family protein
MTPAEKRHAMGKSIVEFEGRYKDGKLQHYKLPPGDGGGAGEVAGINEKHHPQQYAKLCGLIEGGAHQEAEHEAARYIEEYTRKVVNFFPSRAAAEANPAIEFVLRDCAFNRGLKGAATTLQIALGMHAIDGVVGPMTHREFARQLEDPGPTVVLRALTAARETYERNVYPWKTGSRDESSKFWKGLENRWAKAHQVATTKFA